MISNSFIFLRTNYIWLEIIEIIDFISADAIQIFQANS